MLVPLLQQDYARALDQLADGSIEAITDQGERDKKVGEILKSFKENLSVGESLLIMDTAGGNFDFKAGYQFADVVKAYGEFGANTQVISRLHIYRASEDKIHIYKDLGNSNGIFVTVGLKAIVPVIEFRADLRAGSARTKYYELNLAGDVKSNPGLFKTARALRDVFLTQSLESVDALQKPYTLEHKFDETQGKLQFFFFEKAGLKSDLRVEVTHPQGTKREFFRTVSAEREGVNFEQFTLDILNNILEKVTNTDFFFGAKGNGIPGDTIFGEHMSRSLTLDGVLTGLDSNANQVSLDEPYLELAYSFRGWKADRAKVEDIMRRINQKQGFRFYNDQSLGDMQNLLLYKIILQYQIYAPGLDFMSKIPADRAAQIFMTYGILQSINGPIKAYGPPQNPRYSMIPGPLLTREELLKRHLLQFLEAQRQAQWAQTQGDFKAYANALGAMVSVLENTLNCDGLAEMFGGKENFLITSRIEGFKEGDENGDQPFLADTVGEYGSERISGPIEDVRRSSGMTESEFYLFWLMSRFL